MNFNTIKIALRGYWRNRTYSLLNLFSISLVLVVAYLGIGYLLFEFSYDKFHTKSESIYRLAWNYRSQSYSIIGFPSRSDSVAKDQLAVVNSLKDLPTVKSACQFITSQNTEFLRAGKEQIPQDGLLFTNTPKEFIAIFTWQVLLGSNEDFARGGNRVLLTASVAKKLFGNSFMLRPEIIGSEIQIADKVYLISAIIADVPANSHFTFQVAIITQQLDYWGSRIYLEKEPTITEDQLTKQVNQTIALVNPRLAKDELYRGHFLQPITSIHLYSSILYELKEPGNKRYILIVAVFTCFIFLIGAFNYSNITMAIYSKQRKALATKKAMGATAKNVSIQMWIDGVLLSLLAIPIVIVILSFVVPEYNSLMGVNLEYFIFKNGYMLASLIALSIFIGSIASIGPIVALSRKSVLRLFKESTIRYRFPQMPIRNYLVISQFIILITISSLSYFVLDQLNYISKKDIGYQTENILYAYTSPENVDQFQQQIKSLSGVKHVANGSTLGTETFNMLTYQLEGSSDIYDNATQLYVDAEALSAYGLVTSLSELPTGRFTLVNRTAAETFAKVKGVTTNEIIGLTIITEPEYLNPETGNMGIPFQIAGIFEDIHLFSLHEKVQPYFLTVSKNVRMDGRTIIAAEKSIDSDLLRKIQTEYTKLGEIFPLEIELLDENVKNLYQQDRQFGQLLFYLNIIAIVLSGVGLIGITIFTLKMKVKEIGIRKVLGARVIEIVKMMSAGYLFLVSLSLVIAWPLAYFLTQAWLQEFAYRVEMAQWVFPLIGLFTLIFTIALVAIISGKAALTNPVESIKNE